MTSPLVLASRRSRRHSLAIFSAMAAAVTASVAFAFGDRPSQETSPPRVYLPSLLARGTFVRSATAQPTSPSEPTALPTQAATGRLLLNEIGLEPASGEWQFVELANVGSGPIPVGGLTLTSTVAGGYVLPAALDPLPSESLLLVRFDGEGRIENGVVHADRHALVQSDGDELVLADAGGNVLDRVAWGRGRLDAVPLGAGGVSSPVPPGSSLGRLPGAEALSSSAWAPYLRADATPGQENALPPVEAFPMIDGLISTEPRVSLSWYPSRGATSYVVELSEDEEFTTAVAESTVLSPTFTTAGLAAGTYYWRVRALGLGDHAARISRSLRLTVEEPVVAEAPLAETRLAVPLRKQRKDTAMLLLETRRERSEHGWDVAHPDLLVSDNADNTNCGLATVAMVAAFYGGNVSQDRLGFELFRDDREGPELDLKWGQDIFGFDVIDLLDFALGPGTVAYWAIDGGTESERRAFWESAVLALDDGRPVPVCGGGHCVVVNGYIDGLLRDRLLIQDPWLGSTIVDADRLPLGVYALLPASVRARDDETSISTDADGDGIVDFDETERFGTQSANSDSDGDGVNDKNDVRLSVFDSDHGYVFGGNARTDLDGDGVQPEHDRDSDDGGCLDGQEDFDQNGYISDEGGETSPFDASDDKCISGTWSMRADWALRDGAGDSMNWSAMDAQFFLRPAQAGQLEGHAYLWYDSGSHNTRVTDPCPIEDGSMPEIRWESDLTGTFIDNLVSVDGAPTHGYGTFTVVNSCGYTGSAPVDVGWPGDRGVLVDGVADEVRVYPHEPPATGAITITVHMEQGQPQSPGLTGHR